jgi:hypothetical protein
LSVYSTLTRVFAREYYRLNAGFFLLVVGFSFGFLRDVEHIALAQYFVSIVRLTIIPVSVWILYTIKVMRFNHKAVFKNENSFCFHYAFFSKRIQLPLLLVIAFFQLLPITLYGLFLILVALRYDQYDPIGTIAVSIVFLHGSTILALHKDLGSPAFEFKRPYLRLLPERFAYRPYFFIPIEWVFRTKFIQFAATKIFSCSVIFGTFYLCRTGEFDLRLAGIGLTVAYASQMALLYSVHHFNNIHLSINRNLPIPLALRTVNFASAAFALCLPETGLIIGEFPKGYGSSDLINLIFYGVSILIALYAILFIKSWELRGYVRRVFYIMILSIVFILFNTPVLAMAIAYTLTGLLLWHKYYYSFEYDATR